MIEGFCVCTKIYLNLSSLVLFWVKIMAIVMALVIIITFLFLLSSEPPPLLFLQFSLLAFLCLLTPSPRFLAYSSTSFSLALSSFSFSSSFVFLLFFLLFQFVLTHPYFLLLFFLYIFLIFVLYQDLENPVTYVISVIALDIIFKWGN